MKSSKDLYYTKLTDNRVKCKCSHSVYIPRNEKTKICDYCFKTVYRNEKEEFKDKMQKILQKSLVK